MNFVKQIERLQRLNKLIAEENTGTPTELADKLRIRRSTLYELLDYIKSHGVEVSYDRKNHTFYYASNARLDIKFSLTLVSCYQLEKISGGRLLFWSRPFFMDGVRIL